jgi:hypothetical protein
VFVCCDGSSVLLCWYLLINAVLVRMPAHSRSRFNSST